MKQMKRSTELAEGIAAVAAATLMGAAVALVLDTAISKVETAFLGYQQANVTTVFSAFLDQ
jgi:hypothetical protein|tara:strand:- start:89 stop:271 length:183 start_codon:yes stop_codon:yes gene_type:complete